MTWTEARIARAIQRQTLSSRCLLLVPNCIWTGHEADLLGVTVDGRLIDVEVKISRADFRCDARKEKWWQTTGWRYDDKIASRYQRAVPVREARLWPPKVWKHYYALPADLWRDDMLAQRASQKSGVLLLTDKNGRPEVRCMRRATPNTRADRLRDTEILDIARLANLRMWDALQ